MSVRVGIKWTARTLSLVLSLSLTLCPLERTLIRLLS